MNGLPRCTCVLISVNDHPICDDSYFQTHGFQYLNQPVELLNVFYLCLNFRKQQMFTQCMNTMTGFMLMLEQLIWQKMTSGFGLEVARFEFSH